MEELKTIQIHIGGKEYNVRVEDITPETTLNSYIRDEFHLTGTKKCCGEGGCGACIVAAEKVHPDGSTSVFAINSCLVSMPSCHGWKIHTVEDIGNPLVGYHQVQELLAKHNGTQCGYCSPGMVMNMYALVKSGPKTREQIENSFGGNICRCTGYRPIMEAFYELATDDALVSVADIEDVGKIYQQCPKIRKQHRKSFSMSFSHSQWIKVFHLGDLLDTLRTSGNTPYILVAGNTAKGVVWQTHLPQLYIDVSVVEELVDFNSSDDVLTLGGNVTLTRTMDIMTDVAKKRTNFTYLNKIVSHIDLVANVGVRNLGTLAGNLMLKHQNPRFQSDIFLLLETVAATIVIMDTLDNEYRKSAKDFIALDMNKKVIKEIVFKALDETTCLFRSYKIMGRAQNTHAIVNAGFLFKMSGSTVKSADIIYGGINTNFVHANLTEQVLKGRTLFDNTTLQKAFTTLNSEIIPDFDPPDPSAECRKQLAINLFYKCVLSFAPASALSPRHKTGAALLQRPLSQGVQEYSTRKELYPLTEPVPKYEAMAQTSGQAQYVLDMPPHPNELHACFVTAETTPGSTLISITPTRALALEGVVAFYSAEDIPGVNNIAAVIFNFKPELLFCSNIVEYYSQPVGIIVATSHEIAYEAAQMVNIKFENAPSKPLITAKDVVNLNRTDRIIHQTSVVPKIIYDKNQIGTTTLKGEFYGGSQYHFHMENQCCSAVPKEDGLDIYAATQFPAYIQTIISQVLNMDAQKIDITVKRVGGSFGGKIFRSTYVSCAVALAASKLQKPVRMWMPLHHNMNIIGKRIPLYSKYDIKVDNTGMIKSLNANLYSDYGIGPGNDNIDEFLLDCYQNCYKIDSWDFDTYIARTDTAPNTYTRAPGTLEGLTYIESIMEEIAYSLNLDPINVRLANLDRDKHPLLIKFIDDFKTKGELDKRRQAVIAYNKANRWMKKGISTVLMKWNLSVQGSYSTLVAIHFQNGGVSVCHGGIEIGQGINTKVAQVVAHKFGIPMNKVSIKPTSSWVTANSFATGGSWTTEAICQSAIVACDELLDRLKPIRKTNPTASWAELVMSAHFRNISLTTHGYSYNDKKAIQAYDIYGACVAEVNIDLLTGQRIISRVDIIEDVGETISPLVDIGQIEGAFVMGLGFQLMEDIKHDSKGKVLTNRSWNYTPPGCKDIPVDFRVSLPGDNPNPVGILKTKATGEPPACLSVAVPLAIRNALASARSDADRSENKWVPFDGPTTVEFTLLNSLNNYTQYTL